MWKVVSSTDRGRTTLERMPHLEIPCQWRPVNLDVHAAEVYTENTDKTELLEAFAGQDYPSEFHIEQQKDPELHQCLILPDSDREARSIAAQALNFAIVDGVLYFVDTKEGGKRSAAVPRHLQRLILEEYHSGRIAGSHLYAALSGRWWWRTMYKDTIEFSRNCGGCAIVVGVGRWHVPPLHRIPDQRPLQIMEVDIMELPVTEQGNHYCVPGLPN